MSTIENKKELLKSKSPTLRYKNSKKAQFLNKISILLDQIIFIINTKSRNPYKNSKSMNFQGDLILFMSFSVCKMLKFRQNLNCRLKLKFYKKLRIIEIYH
ncbi:hypothetical protein PPERSA_12260 [Pseudocohnilembus persalinus]|uniref:Uncharacterized protein n=1 Tax=Pseudocohnilembus persalinus TaxID=266149 RepID=A0A0V0R4V1_PSEPJ|nr:hypothetical protein PPERSA_12260 [Pseudocohnilembus persalinus]|eukprot:KRX09517.1 hypothetical protein PPERSA_12260 [Pseudocohnilembus persalinus]